MDINEIIIRKWNIEGLTQDQIAKDLKLNRNIVAGRINRLRKWGVKLTKRSDQRREISEAVAKRKKLAKEEQAKNRALEDRPKPNGEFQCTLVDLQFDSCRFIVHDAGENTIYCGEKIDSRHFCTIHYKLCYEPARKRRSKPFVRSRQILRNDKRLHQHNQELEQTRGF